jgi:hypothetical protein
MKFHICPVCENEWKFGDCGSGCRRGVVVCPLCDRGVEEGGPQFGTTWYYLTDVLERFVKDERKKAGL